VQEFPGFDMSLNATFDEPRLDRLTANLLACFKDLADARAVDGAHGAVLDPLASEVMAPEYKAAADHWGVSIRIIEMLDQQAIEVAGTTYELGLKAADEAETLEDAADSAYLEHVGLKRVRSSYREATDWDALKTKLRAHKLALKSDQGIMALVDHGFRYDNPADGADNPAAAIDNPAAATDNPPDGTDNPPDAIDKPTDAIDNPADATDNQVGGTDGKSSDTDNKVGQTGEPKGHLPIAPLDVPPLAPDMNQPAFSQ